MVDTKTKANNLEYDKIEPDARTSFPMRYSLDSASWSCVVCIGPSYIQSMRCLRSGPCPPAACSSRARREGGREGGGGEGEGGRLEKKNRGNLECLKTG